jgi:hypothetical protein
MTEIDQLLNKLNALEDSHAKANHYASRWPCVLCEALIPEMESQIEKLRDKLRELGQSVHTHTCQG